MRRPRLNCAVFLCVVFSFSHAMGRTTQGLEEARRAVLEGKPAQAVVLYASLAKNTAGASLRAEYAYALALSGFVEPALIQLDFARQTHENAPEVWFFASRIFRILGQTSLAEELWPAIRKKEEIPKWIRGSADEVEQSAADKVAFSPKAFDGKAAVQFLRANQKLSQGFHFQSVMAFQKMIEKYPGDYLARTAYSIALEKIHAYRLAAEEAKKAQDLAPTKEDRLMLAGRITAIQESAKNLYLQGERQHAEAKLSPRKKRWLAYGGGQVTSVEGGSASSLNFRLGKFFTERWDAAMDLGVNSMPGTSGAEGTSTTTFGFSTRFYKPLKGRKPMDFVFGGRAVFASGDHGFSFSPGLSQETSNGALEAFLDVGTGVLKGVGLSLGYTFYFGGSR